MTDGHPKVQPASPLKNKPPAQLGRSFSIRDVVVFFFLATSQYRETRPRAMSSSGWDIVIVVRGRGKLCWSPDGMFRNFACLRPQCVSVGLLVGEDNHCVAREVWTTKWSEASQRYIAALVPLTLFESEHEHVLIWPIARNNISRNLFERAKTTAMCKPDVPVREWLFENTGIETKGPDESCDRDWSMELLIFTLHRMCLLRREDPWGEGDEADESASRDQKCMPMLQKRSLDIQQAFRLHRWCVMEPKPFWFRNTSVTRDGCERADLYYTPMQHALVVPAHVDEAQPLLYEPDEDEQRVDELLKE